MTLRTALIVGLRLYAINLAIQMLALVPAAVLDFSNPSFSDSIMSWAGVLEAAILGILAALVWVMTVRLANAVVRGVDGNIVFQITAEEATAVAFVFLGLYFALEAISPVIMSLYSFLTFDGLHLNGDRYQTQLFSRLCTAAIELFFGMGCVLGSKSFAKKLTRGKMWPNDLQ